MTTSSEPRSAPKPTDQALSVPDDEVIELHAPDYDPADYRWVPVRRVPRHDGWTEEKQRRFIETLADTGLVHSAAKAVGMSRESAYRLRRSAHGAAFARAWDAARHHAGALIEDIAFERAIEGVEHEVYNDCGEVVGARLVHDNRLLKYLLSHLKPERYGAAPRPSAIATPANATPANATPANATPVIATPANGTSAVDTPLPPADAPSASMPTLEESLRAMEPILPAPAETLLGAEQLADELTLAEMADGTLPHFLAEQRPPLSPAQLAAKEAAERHARGAAAVAKSEAGHKLTDEEYADECFYIDPVSNSRRRRRSR